MKNNVQNEKKATGFVKNAVRSAMLPDLLGWPPSCAFLGYQPKRPERKQPEELLQAEKSGENFSSK